MQDSVFTRIIKGEIPCHKVYEDEKVIAFLTIEPQQPGHTLVIPKEQVDVIWDLPEETYDNLWQTARKIAKHMNANLNRRIGVHVEGIGVPHAHIHLVPFDTTEQFLSKPMTDVSQEELAKMAEKIRF